MKSRRIQIRRAWTKRNVKKSLRGNLKPDGSFGPKRLAYFNCYGAGAIDDFDAARIGTYINQRERRGVFVGSWWYFGSTFAAEPPAPSFDIREAALHCYLVTGWKDVGRG